MPSLFPRRLAHAAMLGLATLVAVLMIVSGLGQRLDWLLDPARFAVTTHRAGDALAVVEMDAASAAAIRRWPWSRDHYARVVDRLRLAGARSITFDVDFSSTSTTGGDAALTAALVRAPGLVALPTFAQRARLGDERSVDSLPLAMFRPHVALASVSMLPDPDGIVRSAPFGTVTAGTPRPSLSAFMAARSGAADTFFPIDFSIDPASLARLSFIAVERGTFDPAAVRGRDILIGATAIEMGDRYATPLWGVLPGVIVQAMAAETLRHGVPAEGSATLALLVALLIGWAVLRLRGAPATVAAALAAPVLLFGAAVLVQARWQLYYPLGPALVLVAVVIALRFAMHLMQRFERQRLVDEDSGLPNRRAMLRALADRPATRVAVATVGNYDTLLSVLGDAAGRDLMLRVADRLQLVADGATVFRLSDRLLGFELAPTRDVEEMLTSLRALLLAAVEVRGRRVDPFVHVGVADAGGSGHDRLAGAMRAADEAAHGGVFWRQSSADLAALDRDLSLMSDLDQAIAAGEIEVHYQPKLALAENRVTSVEALVRWRHPVRGMIPPDQFIPLAEHSDRIAPLTLFVLKRVVADLADWAGGGITLTAAVNMSAKLVGAGEFGDAVRAILSSGAVDPTSLILEVTESATLADPDLAAATLREWRDLGVAISMDDYGTGQSTLSYLRQLPLSELKIDRSFVQHAHRSRADGVMVRSTVDLAHALGLKVVAEGIEEEACLQFLREVGCDMAQGYLISRPLPAPALLAYLAGPQQQAAAA